MTTVHITRGPRPDPTEYAPYYGRYIALVADGDIVATLRQQIAATAALLETVSEERAAYRYAAGKWSIREVLGHLCDGERIFTYRALRFARRDSTELPGFDENQYMKNASFDVRSLRSILAEFQTVRAATLSLFEHLTPGEWEGRGTANGAVVTVRGIAWIIAGHELHHVGVLRERYGV